MSKPPLFPQASVSGIVSDPSSSQRVIPESRRADGSIRKERKVKPGFTPAEDVRRFRSSRALKAERNRIPPGSAPKPPIKKKELQLIPDAWDDEPPATEVKPLTDQEKQARTLGKKVKAIQALAEKQSRGEKLQVEQINKLSTLDSLQEELSKLSVRN